MKKVIIGLTVVLSVAVVMFVGKEHIENNAVEQYIKENTKEQNMVLELVSDVGYHFQDENHSDDGFLIPRHEGKKYGITDDIELEMAKVYTVHDKVVEIEF